MGQHKSFEVGDLCKDPEEVETDPDVNDAISEAVEALEKMMVGKPNGIKFMASVIFMDRCLEEAVESYVKATGDSEPAWRIPAVNNLTSPIFTGIYETLIKQKAGWLKKKSGA